MQLVGKLFCKCFIFYFLVFTKLLFSNKKFLLSSKEWNESLIWESKEYWRILKKKPTNSQVIMINFRLEINGDHLGVNLKIDDIIIKELKQILNKCV